MIRHLAILFCDLCGKRGPSSTDSISVTGKAKRRGWREVKFDVYGNAGQVCRRCGLGKTERELVELILARAEES
jgi:formamidopyrimidine-DNA glycosylase